MPGSAHSSDAVRCGQHPVNDLVIGLVFRDGTRKLAQQLNW